MQGDDDLSQNIQNQADTQEAGLERLRHISESLLEPELAVHIVENAQSAVIVARKDQTILYVNRQAEFLLGYPRAEMFDRKVEMLIPERLRMSHQVGWASWVKTPRIIPASSALLTCARMKDGTEIDVAISVLPVVITAGFFIVAVIRKN